MRRRGFVAQLLLASLREPGLRNIVVGKGQALPLCSARLAARGSAELQGAGEAARREEELQHFRASTLEWQRIEEQ